MTRRLLAGLRADPAAAVLLAVVVVGFLAVYGRVLVGDRLLVAVDGLLEVPPWAGTPAGRAPTNRVLSDEVDFFLPNMYEVRDAFLAGRIPAWNPLEGSGTPLLGNDQAAPFSPFTLLAVPFTPERGRSLAMLVKLWIAGAGMYVYLRVLGTARAAAILGGVVYATGSFVTVWLFSPAGSVAAVFPWLVAATERFLATRGPRALAGVGLAVGLMGLVGHVETAAQFLLAYGVYVLVRLAALRSLRVMALLLGAGVIGAAIAAIQLIPFAYDLSVSTAVGLRGATGTGLQHLPLRDLLTWVAPNAWGSPALSTTSIGPAPNYNEAVAFVGVCALILVPIGFLRARRTPAVMLALAATLVLAVAIAYGPLTSVAGSLPGLRAAHNTRLVGAAEWVVAALAGLGFDLLLEPGRRTRLAVPALLATAGGLALTVLLALGAYVATNRMTASESLSPWHGLSGFWLLTGAVSLTAAVLLVAAAATGRGRWAYPAAALVLCEGAFFATPYNPQLPAATAHPSSQVADWLRVHATGKVTGEGLAFFPNTATLLGLHDPRQYDVLQSPRAPEYWQLADPRLDDRSGYLFLNAPAAPWLAAAGVEYIVTWGQDPPPAGTSAVLSAENVTVHRVPGWRQFAFLAPGAAAVSDRDAAARAMTADPLTTVPVEGSCCPGRAVGSATVERDVPGLVRVRVDAAGPATLVVLQTYWPGWVATVDGRPASIRPAAILFQSVQVPAGTHVVELEYAPATIAAGALLSILGLLVVAALLVWGVRSRRS